MRPMPDLYCSMERVPVYKHKKVAGYALLDTEDAERIVELLEGRTLHPHSRGDYVMMRVRLEEGKPAVKTTLHRVVLGYYDKELEVDHINGDGWDNRRSNLRLVTHVENMQNKKTEWNYTHERYSKQRTSKHRGLRWVKNAEKWEASVSIHGERHVIGLFDTEEEALGPLAAYRIAHTTHPHAEDFIRARGHETPERIEQTRRARWKGAAKCQSGAKYVLWSESHGKWRVRFPHPTDRKPNGRSRKIEIGYFEKVEDAIAARDRSMKSHYGERWDAMLVSLRTGRSEREAVSTKR